jgi:hypothetical protein
VVDGRSRTEWCVREGFNCRFASDIQRLSFSVVGLQSALNDSIVGLRSALNDSIVGLQVTGAILIVIWAGLLATVISLRQTLPYEGANKGLFWFEAFFR